MGKLTANQERDAKVIEAALTLFTETTRCMVSDPSRLSPEEMIDRQLAQRLAALMLYEAYVEDGDRPLESNLHKHALQLLDFIGVTRTRDTMARGKKGVPRG